MAMTLKLGSRGSPLALAQARQVAAMLGLGPDGVEAFMTSGDRIQDRLLQEAGGKVVKWDGTPYKPSDNMGGLLITCSDALQKEIQATLIKPIVTELKRNP